MTGPTLEAWRFFMACLVGLGVGGVHSLLRPLRLHHPVTADLLFLPFLGYAWLYVSFAVCRGDIRIGYIAGILVGALFWEALPGRWLRPVISGIWGLIGRFFRVIFLPFRKIFEKICKIVKKNICIMEKMVYNGREYAKERQRCQKWERPKA